MVKMHAHFSHTFYKERNVCVAAIGVMHFSVRSFGCALFIFRRKKKMIWEMIVVIILVAVIGIPIYMLPSFIAYKRNHKNTIAVILINFFLGATVIGWVGALIWAVLDKQSDDDEETSENMVLNGADAIIKYKNLLDQGVITKEEFEVKKKQLLDL